MLASKGGLNPRKFDMAMDILEANIFQSNYPSTTSGGGGTRDISGPKTISTKQVKLRPKAVDFEKDPIQLQDELKELKIQLNQLKEEKRLLNAKVFSLERENSKRSKSQQETMMSVVDQSPTSQVRSRSLNVTLLTGGNQDQRNTALASSSQQKALEKELADIKSSVKFTRVNELEVSLKCYYQEIVRLRRNLAHAAQDTTITDDTLLSKISDHEHRIEQLKSQISLLEAERDSQSQTIQNHVEEIKSIGDQLQSTQNQYQDLYAYCNSVIEENKKLKHEGETTAASHHSLVVEHNTAILSVIQELGIDENVDQSTPINSLVEILRGHLQENKRAIDKHEEFRENYAKVFALHNDKIKDLQDAHDKKEMEKISLESKIEILNNEMIQYKQSFERTTDLNSKLNSQLREMQAEIFKYQHQIFASVRYPSQMTSDGISLNASTLNDIGAGSRNLRLNDFETRSISTAQPTQAVVAKQDQIGPIPVKEANHQITPPLLAAKLTDLAPLAIYHVSSTKPMSQQLQSYAPTSHEAQSPVPPAPTADHHQILLLSRSVESIKGSRTFTAGDNEEKGPSNVFSRSSSRQNMSDDAGSQHQSSRRASATSPSGGDATNKPYFQASSNRDSFNSEDSRSDQQYSNKSASLRSRQSSQSLLMQQQQQPSLVKPEAVRRSLSFMKSAESIQQSITDSRTSKTNTSNSPESSVGQQVPGSVSLPRIVNDHPTRPSDQSTGSIARSASRNSISGGGSADQQGTLSGDLPPRAITPSTPRRLDPISNTHHPINKTNSLVSQSTGTRSSSSELSYSGTESRSSYSGGTRSRTQSSASSSVL